MSWALGKAADSSEFWPTMATLRGCLASCPFNVSRREKGFNMKDAILFLMSYPLWVRAVIVALLSICALLLLVFKPDQQQKPIPPSVPSVAISVGVNQGGNVAGRDIVLNAGPTGAKTEELIRILQARAERIHRDLSQNFKYVEIKRFLQDFDKLHKAHMQALQRDNLIEAHEYLSQIHSLSYELQRSEFWSCHAKEGPGIRYRLECDSFQRGQLIQWYAGEQGMETLVAAAMAGSDVKSRPNAQSDLLPTLYENLAQS
jgi:hypothetical protein